MQYIYKYKSCFIYEMSLLGLHLIIEYWNKLEYYLYILQYMQYLD